MLTYESLRKIRDAEVSQRNAFVKLPEGFFESVRVFIENKTKLSEGKEDKWEAENARMLLEDILKAREMKLVLAAMNMISTGERPENILPEEAGFMESIAAHIKEFRKKRKESVVREKPKGVNVALLEDLPVFVGTDMKNYGPFKKGDIATLPRDVAEVLVQKNAARRIDAD